MPAMADTVQTTLITSPSLHKETEDSRKMHNVESFTSSDPTQAIFIKLAKNLSSGSTFSKKFMSLSPNNVESIGLEAVGK